MREIEIKLRVQNLDALEAELKARGVELSEPIRQEDTVYSLGGSSNEFQSAKEGDIIIRIRRQEDGARITLKQQRTRELDNIEYEIKVADREVVHQMLLLLNWHPMVEVKETRRKARLGEYELCLDRVENLGEFVEIEKLTTDDADPTDTREELFSVLEGLGLSRKNEETRGYDTQIFQPQSKA